MSCTDFGRFVMFLCAVMPMMTLACASFMDQREIVKKYVQIDDSTANNCIKEVTIQNSEQYSIFSCAMDDFRKTHAFYTAMSCEFASWTMSRIFYFVKQSPIFYQRNFQYHRVYKKLFRSHFRGSMVNLARSDERLRRFISVIHSFTIKNAHVTYYNDVSIFSAFVSLRFKLHMIKFYRHTKHVFNKSDSFIVRLILEEMNVIQRFLAMNCLNQPSDHRNSQFADYWISEIDEVLVGLDTIDSLLVNIRPFELETDHPPCFLSQTLLDNFVSPSSDDPFSCDVLRASVRVTDSKKLSIKYILEKLLTSYDDELLFLYQESVINAIMKLIYKKINHISVNNRWSNVSGMIDKIENINLEISKNIEYFPEVMVNGFKLFKSIIELKGVINELHEHKAYQYLLNRIEINKVKIVEPSLAKVDTIILAERTKKSKREQLTCSNKLEQLLIVRLNLNSENVCNSSSVQKSVKNIDGGKKESGRKNEECSIEGSPNGENSDDESSDDESSDEEDSDDERSDEEDSDKEYRNYFDDKSKKTCHVESDRRVEKDYEEKYVHRLMKRILKNLDDFKCFHQSIKCRHTEHDKYYNNKLIESIEDNLSENPIYDDDQSDRVCSFVLSIYSICDQAVMFINKVKDNKLIDLNQKFIDRVITAVNSIRDYVLTIIINQKLTNYFKTNYFNFFKMALNVGIILLNSQKLLSTNGENMYHLERVINVVKTELNTFETKYCNPSKFNFLLHNNINFIYIGNGSSVEKSIITLFKNIDTNYNPENSNTIIINEMEHINIQYLYDNYILNSKVFSLYGNNVKFFWKGKQMCTREIYEDMIFLILNPYDLYLLYDIYFKFYIAVIYYEINVILYMNNYRIIKNGFSQLNDILSEFQLHYFPQKLHYLINDIHVILEVSSRTNTTVNLNQETLDFLSVSRKRIDRKFAEFGIEFKKHNFSTKVKQGVMYINVFHATKEAFKIINHGLREHVSCFNSLFSKLQYSIPNDIFFEEN